MQLTVEFASLENSVRLTWICNSLLANLRSLRSLTRSANFNVRS